jgi:hypothetical protein
MQVDQAAKNDSTRAAGPTTYPSQICFIRANGEILVRTNIGRFC